MTDSQSWKQIQELVNAGAGYLFINQFLTYIEDSLTEDQLKPLGDLDEVLDNIVKSKPDNIKSLLDGIIDLAKRGVILGRRKG